MAVIAEKNAMKLTEMLKVDGEYITKRYCILFTNGKHEFFDTSLDEVVFAGTKKEMESFIQGFICGRTTQG